MSEPAADVTQLDAFAHLEDANHARLSRVLRDYVPEVFQLNRIIEQRTGYTSEIGKNMLVDVLAHLGTLASRTDLEPADQATQLSKIEEHLRRAIIEHPEEVVRDRLVEVRNLWSEYQREAYTYREEGALRGVPRHQELEEMRTRIDRLMETARKAKPDETSWEESLTAAADMTEAAHVAGDLADKLEQCIGAARRITEQRARDAQQEVRDTTATRRDQKTTAIAIIAIVVTIAFAVGGYLLGKSSTGPASPKTPTVTVIKVPSGTTKPGP